MSRPPEKYLWGVETVRYSNKFKTHVPQWVMTINRKEGKRLLQVCLKLGWQLPDSVLVPGEAFIGVGSPWERPDA